MLMTTVGSYRDNILSFVLMTAIWMVSITLFYGAGASDILAYSASAAVTILVAIFVNRRRIKILQPIAHPSAVVFSTLAIFVITSTRKNLASGFFFYAAVTAFIGSVIFLIVMLSKYRKV